MSSDPVRAILATLKYPVGDIRLYQQIFSLVAKHRPREEKQSAAICCEEYDELSKRLDRSKIQDSCAVRNVLRSRAIAEYLINEKGEILIDLLPEFIQQLKTALYSLGPDRQHDSRRQEHLLKVLTLLKDNKEIQRILKNIGKPFSNPSADQIIRETLLLPQNTPITDAHARRAVLSAWLCYLRQNVGSCFATAPAIIVHDEQPAQFLKDMNELLSSGRLKRTFGGIEYSVPLSVSWGAGDLKKNFVQFAGAGLEHSDLWLSPGLIAALEATDFIHKDMPLKEKTERTKAIILNLFQEVPAHQAFITNAETILRKILLRHFSLTEQDLSDYENRPQEIIQAGLLMQAPTSATSSGGRGQACAQFLVLLERAENAFKSLADNALLKSWEYTLASFAETKAEFTRWNLYSSLGLGNDEKGGIGPAVYEVLQEKIDISNRKAQELQVEYETMYSQLKYLEVRIQRATEKEIEWLKIDYKTKRYEFDTLEEMRDKERHKAQRIANLYNTLIDIYYELFPRYFQEVYDADMHEVAIGPYDDSPAGFRLLYKYGRTNTSQWTYVQNQNEFISALNNFFIATENEISNREEMEGLQQELSDVITAIVSHIKTKEFLETALYRMAAAHQTSIPKNPLEHLDKIDKKPWAYTSGGTMGSLVSCYFSLEQKPSEAGRWVENPMELLVFLIDTVKQIPPKFMDDFIKGNRHSLLIHSPTHAFLLKPTYKTYFEAWQNEAFTYTWTRDNLVKPMEWAVDHIQLDERMMEFLIEKLAELVPEDFRHYFKKTFAHLHGTMTSTEFRNHLIETMQTERGLQISSTTVLAPEEIDSALFSLLPLFPNYQLREKLDFLFSKISFLSSEKHKLLEIFDELPTSGGEPFLSAKNLQDMAKAIICLFLMKTSSDRDFHQIVAKAARACGEAFPAPITVADTNWMKDDFGFLVSPGTGKLEFWRVDTTGTSGAPMAIWEQWLDGSRKDRVWGVYNRPYEYLK